MRKLTKTLAMMSLLTPIGASALGVGEIKLHSALNQNLDAEIPLVTSKPANLSDIRVSLASPAAFERAGLERNFYLSKLRFRPAQKPDGSIVVNVSSRDAIREPYLNFLLEVDWPQGRLLREFTVLLDPPISFQESTVIEEPNQFLEYAATSASSKTVGTAKPVPGKARSKSAPQVVPSVTADGKYGPIMRNDSLWAIAKRLNTNPNVTQEQMMMALYEKNPHAFYQPNVNALKEGQTIRVPDAEELQHLPHKEASRDFYKQWSDWQQGSVSEVVSAKPGTGVSQADVKPQAQLKLLAPSEEGAEGKEVGATTGDGSVEEAEAALEMVENVRKENEALQDRLFEMEEQVAEMEQLLKDKDEELTNLQSSRTDSGAPVAGDGIDDSSQGVAPTEATELTPADQAASVPGTAEQDGKLVAPMVSDSGVKEPKSIDEGNLFSDLTSNPSYVAAAIGLGMAGLVGFAYARRRRAAEIEEIIDTELSAQAAKSSEERDDFIAPVLDDSTTSVSDSDRTTETAAPGGDSSFLSEFTPSDFDALDSEQDEVDPISEADVYLAYGRYQQAEDLIRQAIENDPQREECKLKLLEIFFAAENKDGYEAYSQELHDDGMHTNSEFWNKVAEMGRQICPLSTLFADGEESFDFGEQELGDYLSDDTGEVTTESDEIPIEDESADLQSSELDELKFDQDDSETASFEANELEQPLEPTDEPLEFNVSAEDQIESVDESVTGEMKADLEFDIAPDAITEQPDTAIDTDVASVLDGDFAETIEDAAESDEDEGDFPNLSDMDEVETKLDLAKAYFDMDDQDSARDILNEVLDEGDEGQKKEAEQLMQRLAS